MRKIRVLFNVNGSESWIGGIYYLRNIVFQLMTNDTIMRKCDPIIVCNRKFSDLFLPFKGKAQIYLYDDNNRIQKAIALLIAANKADLIYNYYHFKFDFLGLLSRKAIYWIPDFQELFYPAFFDDQEIEQRKKRSEMIGRKKAPLVLSSKSCLDDYLSKYDKDYKNIYIIPFVSAIEDEIKQIDSSYRIEILQKRNIVDKGFFLISNQFWQHKNHIVVFNAIAELKKRGSRMLFVFTGELKDYRNSDYYSLLCNTIKEADLESHIRILGFISRKEQLALMKAAIAVIQPSLFEGWGTVVEDAKVLDKTILLSDIPVHREQMNNKCFLFDPKDPVALANLIETEINKEHHDVVENGIADMHIRARQYSEEFSRLLNDYFHKD